MPSTRERPFYSNLRFNPCNKDVAKCETRMEQAQRRVSASPAWSRPYAPISSSKKGGEGIKNHRQHVLFPLSQLTDLHPPAHPEVHPSGPSSAWYQSQAAAPDNSSSDRTVTAWVEARKRSHLELGPSKRLVRTTAATCGG